MSRTRRQKYTGLRFVTLSATCRHVRLKTACSGALQRQPDEEHRLCLCLCWRLPALDWVLPGFGSRAAAAGVLSAHCVPTNTCSIMHIRPAVSPVAWAFALSASAARMAG